MRNLSVQETFGWVAAAVMLSGPGIANADHDRTADWGPAVPESGVNTTAFAEGCPIETPDGLSLLIASNRSGFGVNDIWAADRPSIDSAFGEPRKLEPPVSYDSSSEFCPLPAFGRSLFFVSTRADGCSIGTGDIYYTRQSPAGGWSEPVNLGCAPLGPNTVGTEYSPSVVETWYGTFLFYSTNGGSGDNDIYVSVLGSDGKFGPGSVVASLSSPYEDFMPNVRPRDNGGFEIVFNSDRPTWGRKGEKAYGGQDVYTSTAWWLPGYWTSPTNLGPNVNTEASETRATLSSDGKRLHFGRSGDIYVSER
jgi:hypothetical protein